MFETTFLSIDALLRKDPSCTCELDYIDQLSWLLFLKYLDCLETDSAHAAEVEGKRCTPVLDPHYRWKNWAAPRAAAGGGDNTTALSGEPLLNFVNLRLFPYLQGFKNRASSRQTIEYKIGGVFEERVNRIQNGDTLRALLDLVDTLSFSTPDEQRELGRHLEARIQRMGNSGRNGADFYTPRPLIQAIVQVLRPRIGDRICDPAAGTAGFLLESLDFLSQGKLTPKNLDILRTRTVFGREKKALPYTLGLLGLLLRGMSSPHLIHTNSLAEPSAELQEKDRFDLLFCNPPTGGLERKELHPLYPLGAGETPLLFIQQVIGSLKTGGRAAILVKSSFLYNPDKAALAVRKSLLKHCRLHTLLDCSATTWQGSPTKTVVLFFEKGPATQKTWLYELPPGPLSDCDFSEFLQLQKTFADSPRSKSLASLPAPAAA